MSEELIWEITESLESFSGDETLKEIFWSILSFDRRQDSISMRFLNPELAAAIESIELFASHDEIDVVRVHCSSSFDHHEIEGLSRSLGSQFATLLLLLYQESLDSWTIVYLDQSRKHDLRFLAVPGNSCDLNATAKSLASMSAVDWASENNNRRLDVVQNMDVYFPGGMPPQRWEFKEKSEEKKIRKSFKYGKAQPLRQVYRDMESYPLLTAEQERGEDLPGDPVTSGEWNQYRERLVLHNARLVINIALQFPTNILSIEDIVQEGFSGLMRAAQKYEPSRGNRFSTYAWYWIRQAIMRAIQTNANLIRWPAHRAGELLVLKRSRQTEGFMPGERTVKRISRAKIDKKYFSEVEEPFQHQQRAETIVAVQQALTTLDTRSRRIFCRRNGLDGKPEETLEEIGEKEGVTRERIRQIQKKATKKFVNALPEWLREEFSMCDHEVFEEKENDE